MTAVRLAILILLVACSGERERRFERGGLEFDGGESPERSGECGSDDECGVENCFRCIVSTCESPCPGICDDRDDAPIDGASCGCVEDVCAWYD